MPVTTEEVMKALSACNDPELGIDVVSLGLIYKVAIEPKLVTITMTLTTPGCPLVPYFHEQLVQAVQPVVGSAEVKLELTFDPPWHPGLMATTARQQLAILRG